MATRTKASAKETRRAELEARVALCEQELKWREASPYAAARLWTHDIRKTLAVLRARLARLG